jgi:Hydroxyneurosporene synthase (CrtC).
MAIQAEEVRLGKFRFSSSVAADVWHPQADAKAYEWWYFDALSDDGREALVVIFLDNFIFSPRYNKTVQSLKSEVLSLKSDKSSLESETEKHRSENGNSASQIPNPKSQIPNRKTSFRFPAMVLIYYRDGKPLYRAMNEFEPEDFEAGTEKPFCRLGESEFTFESAPYGSGYLLKINAVLCKKRRLKATLEWLSIESDFLPEKEVRLEPNSHFWNLVAPRSDVTGKIEVFRPDGKLENIVHFRGTGYHDHNTDSRWLAETVKDWQWGRAHFNDATVVFYRYRECDESEPVTKLLLIKNGGLKISDADCEESDFARNIFGLRYPKRLQFSAAEGYKLNIHQTQTMDASFFYLRFLSEAEFKSPDGTRHEAFAITEHLAPKALKYRWLDWLIDMRIGRHGKGSFLP